MIASERDIYREHLDFQFSIFESLINGEHHLEVAERSRDYIQELYAPGGGLPYGAELGLSVNDLCNLTCDHCFYASTHDKSLIQREGLLTTEEWKRIINEGLEFGITHFNIVGKEPLLSPEITFLILDLLAEKNGIKYEIITNGTLIERHIDRIKQHPDFYFFSISFDGYREFHDKIRGEGNYIKSRRGLEAISKAGIKNRTIIFTAMPENIDSLDCMLKDLSEAGAEYASIGFCYPTPHNRKELISKLDAYYRVIDKLQSVPKELDITIGVLADEHANILAELYKRGEINITGAAVTQDLAPAIIIPLSESPRIAISCTVLPTMFMSGYRIDCTGAALDYCNDLRRSESRNGFRNLRQHSVAEVYQKSKELWVPYTEKYYDRLSKALKGEMVGTLDRWYN